MIGRIAITSLPKRVLDDPRALDERVGAEDRRLRLADDRRAVEGAVAAGVRDRERAALHLVRASASCCARARRCRSTAWAIPSRFRPSACLTTGTIRPLPSASSTAKPRLTYGRVTICSPRISPLIHGYCFSVSTTARATKIRYVGLTPYCFWNSGLSLLADRDDARHVDLDRARHVRGGVERAAHVLGDPAPHRVHRLQLLAGRRLRPGSRCGLRRRAAAGGAAAAGGGRGLGCGAEAPPARSGSGLAARRPRRGSRFAGGAAAARRTRRSARMSFFVTRPPRPGARDAATSTPCSAAMRATTGETKLFRPARRSSVRRQVGRRSGLRSRLRPERPPAPGVSALDAASSLGSGLSGRGLGRGLRLRPRAAPRLAADHRELRPDLDRLALRDEDLRHDAARGARDLGVDLVRRDLEQRLVGLDLLALLLEPLRDRPLGDGDAHLGHHDVDGFSRGHATRPIYVERPYTKGQFS